MPLDMPSDFTKDVRLLSEIERVEAILARGRARLFRAFQAAMKELQTEERIGAIELAINAGRLGEAMDLIRQSISTISAASITQFIAAGEAENVFIRQNGISVSAFDVADREAAARIEAIRTRVLDQLASAQHRASILAAKLDRQDPRRLAIGREGRARVITESIGFSERDVRTVANYRRSLETGSAEALRRATRDRRFDRTVERAHRKREPLDPERINLIVQRFSERLKRRRAHEIARQEAFKATNEGQNHMYEQAIRAGEMEAADITIEWMSVEDSKVRHSHIHLHGQKVKHGEAFHGLHSAIRFPGDPLASRQETSGCRCWLSRRLKLSWME